MAALQGVQLFPKDSVFNTPVTTMPIHPSSASWITAVGSFSLKVSQQLPVTVVGAGQTFVAIHLGAESAQSDAGPSPIPPTAGVEQNADGHALVFDTANATFYELYQAVLQGDNSWNATQQSIFDATSNNLRTDGWTSCDAAGLPMFALTLRCAEAQSGLINHALRVVVNATACPPNLHIWPGRHDNGVTSGGNPPFGARLRLKASKDISGFSAINRTILQALKTYGCIICDQTAVGGNGLVITGDTDPNWNSTDLANLTSIQVSDFEFTDESSRIVNSNSGQVKASPMTIPTLVQQATAASAAASPASITPALPGSATPGNLLVLCICVTGTTPSITAPAGWTVIKNNVINSVCNGIFFLPNTTAITGPGAVTIGGTSGGAAAAIFEFGGIGTTPNNDLGTTQSSAATSTTPSSPNVGAATSVSELVLCFLLFQAATITNITGTTSDIAGGNIGTAVSTSGAPNAQVSVYWGTSQVNLATKLVALLGASVAWFTQTIRFNQVGGSPIAGDIISGNAGVYVGSFNQGMIGG